MNEPPRLRLKPRPHVDLGGNRIAWIAPSQVEGVTSLAVKGAAWDHDSLILDPSRLVIRVEPDGAWAEAL